MHTRCSFSAPTKFIPLSDQIIEGVPRLEIKRSIAITLELVSIDETNSMWIPRAVKQVNRKPQHFSEDDEWLHEMVQKRRRRSSRMVAGCNLDTPQEGQISLE